MDLRRMLRRARESFTRRAWPDAYHSLLVVDHATPLAGDDLEQLATAAYLIGNEPEFHRHLERAHHAYIAEGERRRAARSAFWLGLTLLFRGDSGRGTGWLARARREIEGVDCPEHGYLLLPLAEQQLRQGDARSAEATAAKAARIGERFGDKDLVACAHHVEGRALIASGEIEGGLALLDEAMLSVVGDELSPIMTGLLYCSVIAACHDVMALERAREWTSALSRWCAAQPQMVAFTGRCLVHRAEILQLGGAWDEAMAEAERACRDRSREADAQAATAALYRQGEIHRLRGEFAEAEARYRDAARAGLEPQPGFALLRAAQGRRALARAAIHRALASTREPLRRAALLPAQVDVLLESGDVDGAIAACRELEDISNRFRGDVLLALAAFARGSVELARGQAEASLAPLRTAFGTWQRLDAPYEAARVRALLGRAGRMLGDEEAATLDLDAAKGAFATLGAMPDLLRVEALCKATALDRAVLTSREREVLHLVAGGNTNRQIASRLRLSERTVDRHVSNILTKLDVPSRAAATAYAYEHGLL